MHMLGFSKLLLILQTSELDFGLFLKVVELCLKFLLLPKSSQNKVSSSSYGQNTTSGLKWRPSSLTGLNQEKWSDISLTF